jgi:hypothetical protein
MAIFLTARSLVDRAIFIGEKSQKALMTARSLNQLGGLSVQDKIHKIVDQVEGSGGVMSVNEMVFIEKLNELSTKQNAFFNEVILALQSVDLALFEPFRAESGEIKRSLRTNAVADELGVLP